MKINRDFKMFGIKFHLNDNRNGILKCNYEFFPKYRLMEYCEEWKYDRKTHKYVGQWIGIANVNTKKEAIKYIIRNYKK